MTSMTELTPFFQEGTKAREKGLQLADNPYDMDTEAHREWRAGWLATYDLDEEDDPESCRNHDRED